MVREWVEYVEDAREVLLLAESCMSEGPIPASGVSNTRRV